MMVVLFIASTTLIVTSVPLDESLSVANGYHLAMIDLTRQPKIYLRKRRVEMNFVNVDLLLDVWEIIRDEPVTWNQREWWSTVRDVNGDSCGTAFCFAGWACQLSGVKWNSTTTDLVDRGVGIETVSVAAQNLLGLTNPMTNPMASHLFRGTNDIHDIRRCLDEILGDDPDVLVEKRRAERGEFA